MYVIPSPDVRQVKHLGVFFVTATWSVLAYVWLYLIKLDNVGSFPEGGATEIIVRRIDYIPDDTGSSVSSNIQDQDNVYLYAIVDGVYQQLTLDFQVSGSFSLYQHTVITEIQVYDI